MKKSSSLLRSTLFAAMLFPISAVSLHAQTTGHSHAKTGHNHSTQISVPAGPEAPTIKIDIVKDTVGGWNLHIITTNFKFTPEAVNNSPIKGQGHAHIYANGKKIARIYGHWFHIGALPKGMVDVTVSLYANDHSALAVAGAPLSAAQHIMSR